mgnify:CR=1 FL=1
MIKLEDYKNVTQRNMNLDNPSIIHFVILFIFEYNDKLKLFFSALLS